MNGGTVQVTTGHDWANSVVEVCFPRICTGVVYQHFLQQTRKKNVARPFCCRFLILFRPFSFSRLLAIHIGACSLLSLDFNCSGASLPRLLASLLGLALTAFLLPALAWGRDVPPFLLGAALTAHNFGLMLVQNR